MILKAENVYQIYGEGTPMASEALKDISFEINEGEFIALIGHTGSGKSTLIQHLNGLIKATSGRIYYKNKCIYDDDFNMKELRSHVGLVFQYPEHQLFEVDVFSDVCFGPKNMGLPKEEVEKRAIAALRITGLDENLYKSSPFELSGGQKRRAAIAGVLAMEPDVLILDEPTAGLDPEGRDEILECISEMHKKRNMTIILVSHSMEDVAKYADRIIVMNKGEIAFDDTPRKVFGHYRELERMGLAAPQVTYLMDRLRAEGFDISDDVITVDEASDAVMKLMNLEKTDD